jgi:hypothetical protein
MLAKSHCGQIIPSYAAAYAVRVLTLRRDGPENGPVLLAVAPTARVVGDAAGLLRFTVPAAAHLAVDVDGYYVPPGIPIDATDGSRGRSSTEPVVSSAAAEVSAAGALKPTPSAISGGTVTDKGDLLLDGASPFPSAGARLEAHDAAASWVVLRPTNSTGAVSFWKGGATTTALLMSFSNDGAMMLADGTFMSGRYSYFPPDGRSTAMNAVHEIKLNYPLDETGGASNRVVLYKASTVEEHIAPNVWQPGPATTKFQAFTYGHYPQQPNINFDSQFHYHNGQYYFRAFATAEGKDTFWVKASPSAAGDTVAGVRARMYVSGPAGFGVDDPLEAIHVKAPSPALRIDDASAAGSVALLANNNTIGPYLASHTDGAGNATLAVSAHRIRFGANALIIEAAPAVAAGAQRNFTNKLQLDSGGLTIAGDITVSGNVNAKYQDMAEWVPATEPMAAGTVVVVDAGRRNAVTPSAAAYQTSVAGVVSDHPGVLLGEASPSKAKVATTGRVKVRVDAGFGPIRAGDLLVSSAKPGVAMRSEPIDVGGVKIHRPGTLIGKALEPLESGEEEILVLLSLQ